MNDTQIDAACDVLQPIVDGYYAAVFRETVREALEAAAAVPSGKAVVTIVRDATGNVVVEARREDGTTAGVAVYTDARDYLPVVGSMIDTVL